MKKISKWKNRENESVESEDFNGRSPLAAVEEDLWSWRVHETGRIFSLRGSSSWRQGRCGEPDDAGTVALESTGLR